MNAILPLLATACAHCGLPLAPGAERFCCAGCAGAYALVTGLGLNAFYRRREGAAGILRPEAGLPPVRFAPHAQLEAGGEHRIDLLVSGLTCGACVWLVEQVLAAEPDVLRARATLSSHRLSLCWRGPAGRADELAAIVARLGFHLVPWSPACLAAAVDAEGRALVRALGIAAFGAFNVMLISLAIWAGAGMGDGTRGLLHWLAATIALPVVAVAGLPFFRSAWTGLRARRANMDLAVSLGVLAITAMSLSEALRDGPYTWFDSATTLLALLLAGRVLDRSARQRTRRAVAELLALQSGTVRVLNGGGAVRELPAEAVGVGDRVLVASGERLLLDGVLEGGAEALLDTAATTGESLPRTVPPGDALPAAAVNMGAPFTMRVTSRMSDSSLARLASLLDQAEQARGRFVTLADRVARVFVPVVHALAAATFLLWWLWAGVAWQVALLHGVAVLIVTCPCGLAIAVPAVQVVAVGALFRRGVLVASPSALERLATADCAVLDKTGTLTEGWPALLPGSPPAALRAAASLARASRHPLAHALVRGCPDAPVVEGVEEVPGQGLRRGACGWAARRSAAWTARRTARCGLSHRTRHPSPFASPGGFAPTPRRGSRPCAHWGWRPRCCPATRLAPWPLRPGRPACRPGAAAPLRRTRRRASRSCARRGGGRSWLGTGSTTLAHWRSRTLRPAPRTAPTWPARSRTWCCKAAGSGPWRTRWRRRGGRCGCHGRTSGCPWPTTPSPSRHPCWG